MIDLDMLKAAVRANDALMDGSPDVPSSLDRYFGATWDDVRDVAEQRALRMILLQRGEPMPNHAATVELTPEERKLMIHYAAIGVDGICIGLRAMAAWVDGVARDAGEDR